MRIFKLLVVLCTTGIFMSCNHFAITDFVAPPNAFGDSAIDVSCVIKNDNAIGEKGSDYIKFYLSIDRYYEDSDIFLGRQQTDNLASGEVFSLSQTLQLPALPAGKYFLIATNETNSPLDSKGDVYFREIELTGPSNGVDLVPMNLFLQRFTTINTEDIFDFHYTVFNTGSYSTKQTEAHYFLSKDLNLDKETDLFIGGTVIPALEGKEKREIIGNTYIPSYEYLDSLFLPYLIIELDALQEEEELVDSNNCIAQQILINTKQEEVEDEGNIVSPTPSRIVEESKGNIEIPLELLLYPNPTTDMITLSLNLTEQVAEDVFITIYTMDGKRMNTLTTSQAVGPYTKQLDLSDYPAATYLVNVTVGNQSFSKRVVLK